MPATSPARLAANRANALKSTGPTTPEGKERSRRNGLKHGMAGRGVVVAEADGPEVDRRASALLAELGPKSTLGRVLVGQLATLSVRMERAARREEEAVASRVRHAAEAFDQARVDRAEGLFEALADDPRFFLRQLLRSPEGVDRLVEAWAELRSFLTRQANGQWDDARRAAAARLQGLRLEQAQGLRIDRLAQAARGHARLDDPEWAALADHAARSDWARARLVEAVNARVAALEEHRATFDPAAIAGDRLGAADLALFDGSREGTLARRYESEARRGFFRALEELRRVEAEVEMTEPAEPPAPAEVAAPEGGAVAPPRPLGSSRAGATPGPGEGAMEPGDRPGWAAGPREGAARGLDGRVIAARRSAVVPR